MNGSYCAAGECTHFVHGRIGLTIDPRISTMPGWRASSFHRSGIGYAPSSKRREVFGELHEGGGELHTLEACSARDFPSIAFRHEREFVHTDSESGAFSSKYLGLYNPTCFVSKT